MAEPIKAVFLDRDGTVVEDLHYPREAEKVTLLPGVADGLRAMKQKGYELFVVSNQSGVGRGIIKDNEFIAVHNRCYELLKAEGIVITEYSYCFHRPDDECPCRKPGTALVQKQFGGRPIDFPSSFMIGDRDIDLFLGDKLGAKSFLVTTGKGRKTVEELKEQNLLEKYSVFTSLAEIAATLPATR